MKHAWLVCSQGSQALFLAASRGDTLHFLRACVGLMLLDSLLELAECQLLGSFPGVCCQSDGSLLHHGIMLCLGHTTLVSLSRGPLDALGAVLVHLE